MIALRFASAQPAGVHLDKGPASSRCEAGRTAAVRQSLGSFLPSEDAEPKRPPCRICIAEASADVFFYLSEQSGCGWRHRWYN